MVSLDGNGRLEGTNSIIGTLSVPILLYEQGEVRESFKYIILLMKPITKLPR